MDLSFNKIISITKASQVEELIKTLQTEDLIKFRPVGDNECNCGIININTNPLSGFTERTINMIDSVLEKCLLTYEGHLNTDDLSSPRKFTEKVLGIPDGRLENLDDKTKMRNFAKDVSIVLQTSDNEKLPTVDFRDRGIGLISKEMPETILSLNHSRKIDKRYLIGSFGQGGSTAFPCSQYTIIISRKFSTDDNINKVAFTIVRYNDKDKENYKMGVYEYVVDKNTNLPLELEVTIEEFDPGTLVRHINMDIGKNTSVLTSPTNSLWFLTHLRLFDSILPIWINDLRESDAHGSKGRTASGNFRRLNNLVKKQDDDGNSITYTHSVNMDFFDEKLKITYWVVDFKDKNKPEDFSKNFVQPSHPIIITLNGQFHGELTNNIIKNDAQLPYLDKLLIIHINCDNVSYNLRRKMFSSTRENLKETEMQESLRKTIAFVLSSDDNLRALNKERRISLTSGSTENDIGSIAEKIKERLKSSLPTITIGGGDGDLTPPGNGGPRTRRPKDDLEPIQINNPPTYLKITSTTNSIIHKKRKFSVKFITDADPTLFDFSNGRFSINISPYGSCSIDNNPNINGGRGVIFFTLADDVKVDEVIRITLLLELANATLTDSVEFIVGEEFKPKTKITSIAKDINLKPVKKDDPLWIDKDWTEESIAYYTETADSLDIYVSLDNVDLRKILKTYNRFGSDVVQKIENYYLENIGYSILYYELMSSDVFKDMETEIVNTIRSNTYSTLNKTICSIIGDNKDLFRV